MSTSADAMVCPPAQPADAATRPAKRVKLFTGAPLPATLCWDESALVDDWTPAVRRFLNRQFAGGGDARQHGNESKWRAISTSPDAHLRTGFTQERRDFLYAPAFAAAEPSFSFSSLPSDEGTPSSHKAASFTRTNRSSPPLQAEEEETAQDDDFIEHSIAVHDDTRSSQLARDPSELDDTTLNLDDDSRSFNTTTISSSSSFDSGDDFDRSQSEQLHHDLPDARLPSRNIAALRDIPPAAHLQRIVPQTVVVNLLVGVIAILPPRAVRTRRGQWRDLAELLVGDETATGLKISFWFAHEEEEGGESQAGSSSRRRRRRSGRRGTTEALPKKKKDPLREALGCLRVQDVVLIENVALDTFRDRVFGYSLRKSIQKNQTRVELLARGGVDRASGLAGVVKVERVKDWVWRLVNPGGAGPQDGGGGAGAGAGARAQNADLPPDTQE
ncbi:hypothetical protein SLS58_000397 [Diplodia intermedia]|uniref:Uncharacterized protein n=1 Tax=Diplodia intermedia TaxID=856260 RepID=A0ABR3U5H4_9PEZI